MDSYTHILQKKGILRAFTVAKVVHRKDIEELKRIIKGVTDDEEEYNRLLTEELARISNMHSKDNPIPGIIYASNEADTRMKMINLAAQKFANSLIKQEMDKSEMALLISLIISKLDLDQEDFKKLAEDQSEFDEDEYDDDEENEED